MPPYINENTMKKLRLMKEPYDINHNVFYVRKGSPYKESLNAMIRKARDTGLFLYWEGLTARTYMNIRDQLAVKESLNQEDPLPTALRFEHITVSISFIKFSMMNSLVM